MAEAAAAALWEIGSAWATEAAIAVASNAAYINAALAIAASTAYGNHQRARAQAAARAAYNASLRDRELMIRSGVAPARRIYGRDRVSGPIVYAVTSGDLNEYLHIVVALAAHECDAIETIWFNEVALPAPDANGDILTGEFALDGQSASSQEAVTTDSGGVATLSLVPTSVLTISRPAADGIGQDILTGWAWTPGTATITGLPASVSVNVAYVYALTVATALTGAAAIARVRVKKYLGGSGQVADADLIAASGGAWTSAHVGQGICYLYVRLTYDTDIFGSTGLPQIRATVRGAKVRDPRTGTTVWTENAALIAADWLQHQRMGLGADAAEVPDADLIAAANICDESVSLGAAGSQARYTFNGSFTSEDTPKAVLSSILSAMAGTCVWTQGRWLIRPGAYRTPALTLTADHLAGTTLRVVPRAARGDLFNAVRVTYRDTAQDWAEVQAPMVTNATYEAQDGGARITRSISQPSAMDGWRAQRLGKIELERARQAVTAELTTSLRGYNLVPSDTVTLQLSRYGWGSGKVFEVRQRTFDPSAGTITYTLRETAAAVFDWAYGEATEVDPAPDTDLPNPYIAPDAPTITDVQTGTAHLLKMADGSIVTRAWVQWDAVTDRFVTSGGRLELQWCINGSEQWQPQPPLPGDATEAYLVGMPDSEVILIRLRAVNAVGRASDWGYESAAVVGKTAAPSNVSGAAGTVGKGRVLWSWSIPTDADWDVIEVRGSDTNWGSLSVPALYRGRASQWVEVVAAAGSLTRYFRHLDTSGNASSSTASASATVADADLAQGATAVYTATADGPISYSTTA